MGDEISTKLERNIKLKKLKFIQNEFCKYLYTYKSNSKKYYSWNLNKRGYNINFTQLKFKCNFSLISMYL